MDLFAVGLGILKRNMGRSQKQGSNLGDFAPSNMRLLEISRVEVIR